MIMYNELVLFAYTAVISGFALACLRLGKEALVAFVCVCCVFANLFVIKQITLFGLTATAADAFSVGAVFGLNLLQEYFGKDATQRAIWINFLLLIFYALVSQLHLAYIPTGDDFSQIHFAPILTVMPRIVVASFVTYFIVQQVDSHLFGRLKQKIGNRSFVVRNSISVLACQLLDTVLFTFFGLYGLMDNILSIMVVSYVIKVAIMPRIFFKLSLICAKITMVSFTE